MRQHSIDHIDLVEVRVGVMPKETAIWWWDVHHWLGVCMCHRLLPLFWWCKVEQSSQPDAGGGGRWWHHTYEWPMTAKLTEVGKPMELSGTMGRENVPKSLFFSVCKSSHRASYCSLLEYQELAMLDGVPKSLLKCYSLCWVLDIKMHDKGKRDCLKEIDTLMVSIMLMILFVSLYLQTY